MLLFYFEHLMNTLLSLYSVGEEGKKLLAEIMTLPNLQRLRDVERFHAKLRRLYSRYESLVSRL